MQTLLSVEKSFGILGVILGCVIVVATFFYFFYFKSYVNKIAELSSEKTLSKFQSELSKDVFRSNKMYEKQVNAIHEVFQRLQKLIRMIDHTQTPEKFTPQISAHAESDQLIKCRHEFKKSYWDNKLLFSHALQEKIDKLLPLVDDYIETYIGGLLPEEHRQQGEDEGEQDNGGLYFVGIWSSTAFDSILPPLKEVSKGIEKDFRSIYGTN